MNVEKRSGKLEAVNLNKITARIEKLCYGLNREFVDPIEVSKKVVAGLYDGVTTEELDRLAAEQSATLAIRHPDYMLVGGRITTSAIHKVTPKRFSDAVYTLDCAGVLLEKLVKVVRKNEDFLNSLVIQSRDYSYDFFGIQTLSRSYLLKLDGKIIERVQYMLLRVSVGIFGDDMDRVASNYNLLSKKMFTHATPTLFNSGLKNGQLASCFLLDMQEDSIKGIYDTLTQCALISQGAGGIGISITKIRSNGASIRGGLGVSNGIVPMLRAYDATARYVDQGGGKRKGSFAVYIEPWHADIYEFLDLKKNHGKEELRARDLFYALWIPDLFMRRVESGGQWSLFDPDKVPKLYQTYGEEFEGLYTSYEEKGLYKKRVLAQDLFRAIVATQIEMGIPYMLYKDAVNKKSNQKNIGMIKSSNLCFTGDTMVAVADGRNAVSIKELAEESKGVINIPVYSAMEARARKSGMKNGKVQLYPSWRTQIKNAVAFKSGVKGVIRITLSNGDQFRCTRDHKLALLDGGYIKAESSLNAHLSSFKNTNQESDKYFWEIYWGEKVKKNNGLKVISIEDGGVEDVYDLTVEDNSNFYIITSTDDKNYLNCQGVLVHNCAEVVEYTSKDEVAVCNLASVSLPAFATKSKFKFDELYDTVYHITLALNKVIDVTHYPVKEAKYSNLRHRPIGIGVQGLADVFFRMDYVFGDDRSRALNKEIFETMYFAALSASKDLAIKDGAYKTYKGSPLSNGIYQFDMWGTEPSDRWDWVTLRKEIAKHGVRNSLLIALMPTASTAQILGNTECFEPMTSNLYVRRVLAGEFMVVNRYLVEDLIEAGLWDKDLQNELMRDNGSVQGIASISDKLKEKYRTVWEISQRVIIDMSADRAPFVDQTQSMNLFLKGTTLNKVSSMHMYGWHKGLKTGMYYLRSRPAADPIKFTVPVEKIERQECNDAACESCSG